MKLEKSAEKETFDLNTIKSIIMKLKQEITKFFEANPNYSKESKSLYNEYKIKNYTHNQSQNQKPPFTGYKAGDDIIIDTEAVAGHPQGAVFGESQISEPSLYPSE